MKNFFNDLNGEFRKITWPKKKKLWKKVTEVFEVSITLAMLISLSDKVFQDIIHIIFTVFS